MKKKIVIIGGGVAGLSAGIYAKLNNFDVEIIEMHSITGGQCTAWDRKGYRFDYCLNWLVGTRKGPFNDIWKVAACRSIRQVGNSIYMQGGENRVQDKITAPREIEIAGVIEIFCKFKRSLFV